MDLTASVQKRADINGNPCALVKIEMISPEATFQGNVIGEVAYNVGEYLVYVSPGTKMLKLFHPNQTPLTIDFGSYGIKQLLSERTYVVKVSVPSGISVIDLEELLEIARNAYFEEQDYKKAFTYFKKASEYNSPEAIFVVSIMMENGRGTDEDKNEAIKWCIRAAELGYREAQYNLGAHYFEGDCIAKDMSKGVEWFSKAALQGERYAMYNLGVAYEFGYGVDVNYDEAEEQFYSSLQHGNDCEEDLQRVRSKNTYPKSEFVDFSLVCLKAGETYCISSSEWASLSSTQRRYYEKVGVFMLDNNNKAFIISERDTDREIVFGDAVKKYGDSILTEAQAVSIKNNTESVLKSLESFGLRPLSGSYWVSTSSGTPKGLVFASDAAACFLLNFSDSSVAAIRPIINISSE